jgi:hypothetical protein
MISRIPTKQQQIDIAAQLDGSTKSKDLTIINSANHILEVRDYYKRLNDKAALGEYLRQNLKKLDISPLLDVLWGR